MGKTPMRKLATALLTLAVMISVAACSSPKANDGSMQETHSGTMDTEVKSDDIAGEQQNPEGKKILVAYFTWAENAVVTPSVSRRGNCYGNAMAENFFGILKTECIYRCKIATFDQDNDRIDRFIHFYNHDRIQIKTGVAPLSLRYAD